MRKGIILAGGTATRLWPATLAVSKQLVPVYDKPMIYYPLTTLILGGMRDILVITTPHDAPRFKELLGDGSQFGVRLSYAAQPKPAGIAQALVLAESFLDGAASALVLGDNLFFGDRLATELQRISEDEDGATIFAYRVNNPERYGVVEFDADGRALSIDEKPARPKSSYAIVGLYFYDENAPAFARKLRPSSRGELEITDLNRRYLEAGRLRVELLGRGTAWLDAGTHDALLDASNFVAIVEQRQGLRIGSPEEAAFRMGWLSADELRATADRLASSGYGQYLRAVADESTGARAPLRVERREAIVDAGPSRK